MNNTVYYCPGNKIPLSNVESGPGTFVLQGQVHASLLGSLSSDSKKCHILHYKHSFLQPQLQSLVYGRVVKIHPKFAQIQLLLMNDTPFREPIPAILRLLDIHPIQKEGLKIVDYVRPGDIVYARVLSIVDSKMIYLSIASKELGVVSAKTKEGSELIPISWEEMMCTETGRTEKRKCAKPVQ